MHAETKARLAEQVEEKKTVRKKIEPPSTKQELIRQFPEPETYLEAVAWLRKHCVTTITMKDSMDRIRVVLRQHDAEDLKLKLEISEELEEDDDELWQAAYLKCAKKAHKCWLENEAAKYD
jgi:hypothetical protein